jgi:hypothetical protein
VSFLGVPMYSGREILVGFALIALTRIVCADAPAPTSITQKQAEARQFGIFLGGTASQYDLCVKKGFLPKGGQSAEDFAKATIENMRTHPTGPDQTAYIQEGWDTIKKEITDHESFFTQEKCNWVAKEWAKITRTVTAK